MSIELSDAAKAAGRHMRMMYERAYTLFLDKLEVARTPENFPLPYELCKQIRQTSWPYLPLIDQMIAGDLTETINQLNAWAEWLSHFSIWTEVLDHFDEQDTWALQHDYVDPLGQICLMQPSAARDRFGHIATNAIHQTNLCTVDSYKDQLKEDKQRRPLGRKQVEGQIAEIGKGWSNASAFMETLQKLDSEDYRQATRNYRNLSSHAIAPRFRFGVTNMVVRTIHPVTDLVQQSDGTYLSVEHPTLKAVSYGFGGTEALDLREVYRLSQAEFDSAVRIFHTYSTLMNEMLAELQAKAATVGVLQESLDASTHT